MVLWLRHNLLYVCMTQGEKRPPRQPVCQILLDTMPVCHVSTALQQVITQSPTVHIGLQIMRGQLSGEKVENQCKCLFLPIFVKPCWKHKVINWTIYWCKCCCSCNSSPDKGSNWTEIMLCFFISCSCNDSLSCVGLNRDPVKMDTLWGKAAAPKSSLGDS